MISLSNLKYTQCFAKSVFITNTQVKMVTCKSVFIVEHHQQKVQQFIAKTKAKNDNTIGHIPTLHMYATV